MAKVYVGAIDCSFNYCGCALIRRTQRNAPHIIEVTRIVTNEKLKKSSSISDLDRAESLYCGVKSFMRELMMRPGLRIFAYEVPGGSQSQRAAACLGMAKGVIASVLGQQLFDTVPAGSWARAPIMPSEVHKRVTGKLKATKDEVIQYVLAQYPDQIILSRNKYAVYMDNPGEASTIERYTKGDFEHIADAIVMAELGFDKIEEKKK